MKKSFYLQWHITNQCNLRCRHCYQDDFSRKEDLDGEGLKKVTDNIVAALQAWEAKACIHLTGGEPLLKSELFPLLEYLDQLPEVEELGIITNGLLLNDEILDRLAALRRFKTIKISLDGADAQVHDRIRSAGNFDRVVKNVPLVQKREIFDVNLMFTVMRSNLESLPAFIRLGEELRVDGMIIERFIPWGRGIEIREEVLDREQWRRMLKALFEYFSMELGEDEIPPYQAFQVDFRGEEPQLLGAPCVLGREGFCVMPQGEVFPCRRFPLSLGNLLKEFSAGNLGKLRGLASTSEQGESEREMRNLRRRGLHRLPQPGFFLNRRLPRRRSTLLAYPPDAGVWRREEVRIMRNAP